MARSSSTHPLLSDHSIQVPPSDEHKEDQPKQTSLTHTEIAEFIAQIAANITLNYITGYNTLVANHYFENEEPLFVTSIIVYTAFISGISLCMLYKFAPYFSHTEDLKEKLQQVSSELTRTRQITNNFQNELQTFERFLDDFIRQEAVVYSQDKTQRTNSSVKFNLLGFFQDIAIFILNSSIGASTGLMLNDMLGFTLSNLKNYLPAPIALGMLNALINHLIIKLIEKNKIFIPSRFMLSHSLFKTNERLERLIRAQEKYRENLPMQLETLKRTATEIHTWATSSIQFPETILRPEELPPAQGIELSQGSAHKNYLANFGITLLGMFPFLMIIASTIFSMVNKESEDSNSNNRLIYIALTIATFIEILALSWRMCRFQYDYGVQVLDLFAKDESESEINKLEENLSRDEHQLNTLFNKANSIRRQLNQKNSTRRDFTPQSTGSLYEFAEQFIGRNLINEPKVISDFKDYLRVHGEEFSHETFNQYFNTNISSDRERLEVAYNGARNQRGSNL